MGPLEADCMTTTTQSTNRVCNWWDILQLSRRLNRLGFLMWADRHIVMLSFQSKHCKTGCMEMSHSLSKYQHCPVPNSFHVLFNRKFQTWFIICRGPTICEACQKSSLVLTCILSRYLFLAKHGLEHSNILSRKTSRHIDIISLF